MISFDLSSFILATAVSLSFRIGKGLSPSEVDLTQKSALKQFNSSAEQVGVRTRSQKSPFSRWTEELIYTLDDRVKEVRLLCCKRRESRE